jgi:hypothetical protein
VYSIPSPWVQWAHYIYILNVMTMRLLETFSMYLQCAQLMHWRYTENNSSVFSPCVQWGHFKDILNFFRVRHKYTVIAYFNHIKHLILNEFKIVFFVVSPGPMTGYMVNLMRATSIMPLVCFNHVFHKNILKRMLNVFIMPYMDTLQSNRKWSIQ